MLEKILADKIEYYQQTVTRDYYIKDQKKFFEKNPVYGQVIKGDIDIQQISDTQYKAEFVKEVTTKKGTKDYPSYLVFKKIGNEWKLILESDMVSDANIEKKKNQKTENPNNILGTFSTISSLDHGTPESRKAALFNGFINEFVGSFVLFFAAMGLTKNYFGAELLSKAEATINSQAAQMAAQGTSVPKEQIAAAISQAKDQVAPFQVGSLSVAHLALGFLVMALVTSLGGPTGPGLNPARDLGPRILHFILPESVLGKHKGDSKWWYSWVPVVAPILAGITAVLLFKTIYG